MTPEPMRSLRSASRTPATCAAYWGERASVNAGYAIQWETGPASDTYTETARQCAMMAAHVSGLTVRSR